MIEEERQVKFKWLYCVILLFTILSFIPACTPKVDEELRRAAIKGHADAVIVFLSKGADVNMRKGGWTVLMFVAQEGQTEVAKILLENGADPDSKGREGETALTIATEKGHIGIVKLLLSKGADVNAETNHGSTALMYAAEYGHPDIVRILLDKGADMNQEDKDGETALAIAGRRGHTRIIQLLKNAGAKE